MDVARLERFESYILPEPNTGCWLWTGRPLDGRYGLFRTGKNKERSAHRLSYELHKGPIPEGLQIDHLCEMSRCVNPEHLEAVTQRVNLLRARKDMCRRKLHEFTPENTKIGAHGVRICLECRRAYRRSLARPYTDPFVKIDPRKSHCIYGHLLSGDNIYGNRACRTCAKRNSEEQRARQKFLDVDAYAELKEKQRVYSREYKRRRRLQALKAQA